MSRYVNADAICCAADETAKECTGDRMMLAVAQGIKNLMNRMHGIDIVRCGECKHWNEEDHWCNIRDSYGWDYKPDDFCSYGERSSE